MSITLRIPHNTLRLIAGGFYIPDPETVKNMAQQMIDDQRRAYVNSAADVGQTAWETEELINEYDRTHAVGYMSDDDSIQKL